MAHARAVEHLEPSLLTAIEHAHAARLRFRSSIGGDRHARRDEGELLRDAPAAVRHEDRRLLDAPERRFPVDDVRVLL